MPFGTKKLDWLGYPMVKKWPKMGMCLFVLTEYERGGRTDGHTDTARRLTPRLMRLMRAEKNES